MHLGMESLPVFGLFFLGAILGSFIGVVAERVYTGQSFLSGRSKCNSCARHLGPLDLVPVVSYLLSAGRCRGCGVRVPLYYALLELSLGLCFALAYLALGMSAVLPVFLLALMVLAFIVAYDLMHTIVPVAASTALVVIGAVAAVLSAESAEALAWAFVFAGGVGFAFLMLHLLTRGRGMGLGDAPIALGLSLLCAPYAYGGLLLSFWIGAVIGILVLAVQKGGPRMGIEVPFAPFLAAGYLAAYFLSWNPLELVMW